jgi:hypothetical protein
VRAAFLIELRRSSVRWWLPILVFVDLTTLLGRSREWIGVWPQASVAAQLPAFFFGMFLAAAAAWSAGRTTRAGAAELLAQMSRPVWQRELIQVSVSLTYGLVAYAIGAVVAAAVSASVAGPGFLWPTYFLLGAALLTASVAVGHLAGRLIKSRFVAPIVALPVIFLNVNWRIGKDHVLYVLSGPVDVEISKAALTARIVFAGCLMAMAVTAVPRNTGPAVRRARLRHVPVLVCALLALASFFGLYLSGPLRVDRTPPSRPVCSDAKPRVCVWPEDRKYLNEAALVAERLSGLPTDLIKLPDAFYEQGLRPGPGSQTDFSTRFGTYGIADGLASSALTATLPKECNVDGANSERYSSAVLELQVWLTIRAFGGARPADIHGGPSVDTDVIARIVIRPDSEQAAWAQEKLDTIGALCG